MNKPSKSHETDTPETASLLRSPRIAAVLGLLIVAVAAFGIYQSSGCGGSTNAKKPSDDRDKKDREAPRDEKPARADPAEKPDAPPSSERASAAGMEKVAGRWYRLDGAYELDIRRVESDGKLEAAYFNPSPIKVSAAEIRKHGTGKVVFVELRDRNYPGCTYHLAYDPQQDMLVGEYFQAMQGATYEVAFKRLKENE